MRRWLGGTGLIRFVIAAAAALFSALVALWLDSLLRGANGLELPALQRVPYVAAFFLLLVAAAFSFLSWLQTDIARRALRIEYIALEDDDWRGLLEASRKIIENARRRILALNSWTEEGPAGKNSPDIAAREKYFKALMDAANKESFEYRRLVQIDPGENFGDAYPEPYVVHFRQMFAKSELSPNVELVAVMPRFPGTFLLVDDQWLVWQLNRLGSSQDMQQEITSGLEQGPKKQRFRMRAVIVVHDPSGRFIRHFRDTFDEASRGRYAVKRDVLEAMLRARPRRAAAPEHGVSP